MPDPLEWCPEQVFKATVKATNEVVALKLLNLEKFGANLVRVLVQKASQTSQSHIQLHDHEAYM